ncbi:hypothetical protein M409DRAFT_52349 [Zasmidium cellare ATCC 36951]|uniref:Nucleolar 27S pre-rRNA processing Urb2/Npa2 C-terminal domain-containing protein n=1 Tax=Zasmidium cellare ATCC 36951 TaxID=1080233 RepID=A0A6A6CRT1_ZASCE|nr:uncharacterized protein M409DRAFT_52349 [Zasmidium cellare ATCC 36951]KAF2169864.1 hypothetical protein M409DRAFT_52349 [Zasmidium cellare ATCC 36951]
MGGISVPERSSLDRLKALDSLPSLEAQLQEANSLCDHSSRAEMILRWLLGKLKASDEARNGSATWELLSSCIRIISTSRIASLLGSNGFIDALQTICSGTDLSTELMHAIAGNLDLLLELCESDSGTAIKSLFSIESSVAAPICGNWFRLVYESSHGDEGSNSITTYALLEPALKIWSLRKRTGSDDELFSANCIVPALLLLRQISDSRRSESHKRKRGSIDVFDARAAGNAIEAMTAKHVILPARAVFFKDREGRSTKSRQRSTETNQPEIKERLGPLKMAVLREDSQQIAKTIPLLLDIALRSVATPTPKHRFNERPWLETLLDSLRNYFSTKDRSLRNQVLAEMLDVIHREGHQVALRTLSTVVKDDAFSSDNSTDVDWNLIAKVARLDANVFGDKILLETLFNAITLHHPSSEEHQLLTGEIAIPVMKAHAKSRTLTSFIDCWSEQLSRPQGQSAVSVWTDLATPFSQICEEAMTSEQIVFLFDKLASGVNSTPDSLKLSDDPSSSGQLRAGFTVLDGLLSGIRNENTIVKLQGGLDRLQCSLQTLAYNKTTKITKMLPFELWTLLARVFNLWYPSWAVQQKNRDNIIDSGLNDNLRGVFKSALGQCAPKQDSQDAVRIAQAAQTYVATICTSFGRYSESKDCQKVRIEAVERLSQEKGAALPVLLRFPSLLAYCTPDARKSLVSHLLAEASEAEALGQERQELSVLRLRALVSTASNLPERPVLDDCIAPLLDCLRGKDASQPTSELELVVLSTFAAADLATFDQEQRVEILDALLQLQPPPSTQSGSVQLQQRLALMVGLLRYPCRGARLLADAEGVWDIVSWFSDSRIGKKSASKPAHPLDSLKNLEIFDELVRCLVGSLMATRNQKSTREILVKHSEQTKKRIEQVRTGKELTPATRTASIVLFKNVFGAVGQGDSDTTGIIQDSDATALYLSAIAAEFKSLISTSGSCFSIWTEGGKSGPLLWIFDALVMIPDALRPSPSRMELADMVKSLAYTVLDFEDEGLPGKGFPELSRIKVASFQVACKFDPTAGRRLLPLAQKLLQRDLSAREYVTVLSTFEDAFEADDDEWTGALQQMMLDESPQTPASLILQQKAIKNLSHEDLEGSQDGTGHLRGTESFTAYQIFDRTLAEAANNTTLQARRIALQTLAIIFKDKSFMVNQYGIEQTLSTLHNLLKTYKHASTLYPDICNVLSTLFASHRSRLQGRFHLLVALFQALLTQLFTATTPSNPTTPIHHAKLLARLLESFSNPQIRPTSKTPHSSSLIDSTRKAQSRAGQYAPYILHHYCAQLLAGSGPEGVREALKPGLWTVIEAMERYHSEGVRVLSAAMNASERAVLRGVYEEWRRFGRWEGL